MTNIAELTLRIRHGLQASTALAESYPHRLRAAMIGGNIAEIAALLIEPQARVYAGIGAMPDECQLEACRWQARVKWLEDLHMDGCQPGEAVYLWSASALESAQQCLALAQGYAESAGEIVTLVANGGIEIAPSFVHAATESSRLMQEVWEQIKGDAIGHGLKIPDEAA